MSQISEISHFEGRVLLIHTTDVGVVRALEKTRTVMIGSESFLEGTLLSPTPGHFDDGKVVRLNLRFIVSITEFDSVEQFMTRKKGELKLLSQDRLV